MVKQGDIIKVSFDPKQGHEQAGFRPALVISNNEFPLHVPLDGRTSTTGVVLCEHVRTLDLSSRENKFVEKVPDDILKTVTDIVFAEVEIID